MERGAIGVFAFIGILAAMMALWHIAKSNSGFFFLDATVASFFLAVVIAVPRK